MKFSTSVTFLVVAISVLLALASAHGRLNMRQHKNLKTKFSRILKNRKDLIPRFVQLAFHDCIGGCDGCVNTTDPNNINLAPVVRIAANFRRKYARRLSQADINVFVSIQALECAAKNAKGKVSVPFSTGRKDCKRSNGLPVRTFAHGRGLDSLQFLARNFGTNTRESVALLGVHTLGRCNAAVSGFEGPWDATQHALDNKYYKNMIQRGWFVEKRDELPIVRSSQWTKNKPDMTMMLHADMIMYKNFTTSGPFDTPSCSFDHCPLSSTANIVKQFAKVQRSFHRTLEIAFKKMVDGNGRGLKRVD